MEIEILDRCGEGRITDQLAVCLDAEHYISWLAILGNENRCISRSFLYPAWASFQLSASNNANGHNPSSKILLYSEFTLGTEDRSGRSTASPPAVVLGR
jgi:hypothetical protein